MTFLSWFLLSSVIILLILLGASIYYNIKHGLLLLGIIERIEKSLDILDERYNSISEILNIPLFYDSPQIRKVLDDIKLCRDSILEVANTLVSVEIIEEIEEENSLG